MPPFLSTLPNLAIKGLRAAHGLLDQGRAEKSEPQEVEWRRTDLVAHGVKGGVRDGLPGAADFPWRILPHFVRIFLKRLTTSREEVFFKVHRTLP